MADPTQSPPTPGHRRLLSLGILGAAVLTVAGGVAFWYASGRNAMVTAGQGADVTVHVGATDCQPNVITVPGGRRSFEIVNDSNRPIEWEILDGVMVLAERENIAPGFRQTLTAQLVPGDYQITCGLLSNPRGVLHVTQSDEAVLLASEVTVRKFLGPLAEYRVYLLTQGRRAISAAEALQSAIAGEDLEGARIAWLAARAPYRRIEALASRFSDLENTIDPSAAYLAAREDDAAFTGYHRIEYGLFAQSSTEDLAPVADQLVADLRLLSERLAEARLDPLLLTELPGALAGQLVQGQIASGENLYSGSDLADLAASMEGMGKLIDLLTPLLEGVDPALETQLRANLEHVDATLSALKTPEGWPDYRSVPQAQRDALAEAMAGLQATLDKLPAIIGLSP